MELNVTMAISVKLTGSIEEKTEKIIYIEHLHKEFRVEIPNVITENSTLRLKGLGFVSPNGQRGDLFLKFRDIDRRDVYVKEKSCYCCGNKLIGGEKFCSNCGASIAEKSHNTQRQQEWYGKIIKCPACGESVPSFTSVCPNCGHEFRGAASIGSVKEFIGKFENAVTDTKKIDLIRTFPIPNTREDILEFMILAVTNIENSFQAELAEAWSVKFTQAYEKSRVLYGESEEFARLQGQFLEKKKNNNQKLKEKERLRNKKVQQIRRKKEATIQRERSDKRKKQFSRFFEKNKNWILPIGCGVAFFLLIGAISFSHMIKEWRLNNVVEQVEEYIAEGDYEKAKIKANQIIDDSGWSTESEIKWDDIRASLLETIEEKKAIEEGKIILNFAYKDLIGQNYIAVEKKLKQQGFTNIHMEAIEDVITGWITKDGEVEEVTINGEKDFLKGLYYPKDAEIIITYHTK